MLDSIQSLLPPGTSSAALRVLCVGFESDSLTELERLLHTLGPIPVGRVVIHSRKIDPATYLGKGKIEEIAEQLLELTAQGVIFDGELSPNQLKNLEKHFQLPILDRPGVIIEIFSHHARTREAKTQVELARLQYLLPRLTHFWSHFERQRGGGTGSRGMGEKQFEVDRRLVKARIAVLRQRLVLIEKERGVQRQGRKQLFKVALVGYTNAGKSTLLNALTWSEVRAEDLLFATLDASVRSLTPHSHPPVVLIDTVGFINQLPPALVASFHSTLEELKEADLLVHVVDASHPNARQQLEVTEQILESLGVGEKPRLLVLNKADQIDGPGARNRLRILAPKALVVSSLKKKDMQKLREQILQFFYQKLELWEVLIPYGAGKLEAELYEFGVVEQKRHLEKGTFFRLKIDHVQAKKLELGRYKL